MSGPLGVTHLLVFSQPPASSALIPLAQAAEPVETTAAGKKNAKAQAEERAEKSLSEGTTTLNLRLIRLPRGPTLGFKVLRYSLASDILRMARRPRSIGREFAEGPLVSFIEIGMFHLDLPILTLHTSLTAHPQWIWRRGQAAKAYDDRIPESVPTYSCSNSKSSIPADPCVIC